MSDIFVLLFLSCYDLYLSAFNLLMSISLLLIEDDIVSNSFLFSKTGNVKSAAKRRAGFLSSIWADAISFGLYFSVARLLLGLLQCQPCWHLD